MRHILASALATMLLAGTLSPAYADSRNEHGRHEGRWDSREHRGPDRNVRRHDRRDYRHDGRYDGRRDYGHDGRYGDRRDYRHDGRYDYRRDGRRWDHDRYDHRRFDGRRFDERRFFHTPRYDYGHSKRFYGGAYYRPHGYRHYSWHRGDYLPRAYYAPRYVVRDYGSYRLYAPPRGHHWVRVGDDVVLAAIASGLVVGVVGNLFY